jgi:hypothetical protein
MTPLLPVTNVIKSDVPAPVVDLRVRLDVTALPPANSTVVARVVNVGVVIVGDVAKTATPEPCSSVRELIRLAEAAPLVAFPEASTNIARVPGRLVIRSPVVVVVPVTERAVDGVVEPIPTKPVVVLAMRVGIVPVPTRNPPQTSSRVEGVVVPIPTVPDAVIRILSLDVDVLPTTKLIYPLVVADCTLSGPIVLLISKRLGTAFTAPKVVVLKLDEFKNKPA